MSLYIFNGYGHKEYFIMLTLVQKKTIYRARRGLKELDIYFDLYVKKYYLVASEEEQAIFNGLVEYEDPDLLDWFLNEDIIPSDEIKQIIRKLKQYFHG